MELWWKNTAKGKTKYTEKNLSLHYLVHHKSHMHWSGIKHGPPW
jgi:hypothetical protein